MSSATAPLLTGRDVALLRAVAAGRCRFSVLCEPVLLVDGVPCADFTVAGRLIDAGLLVAPGHGDLLAPAGLTDRGRAVLGPVARAS